MMEVSDESEICKARQYDLGSDETLRESEIKHPTYLSVNLWHNYASFCSMTLFILYQYPDFGY